MAQNLVLNILAKDKTKQALNGVRAGLTNLKGAVFSVQSAILGIGGGLAIKSILNVGSTVEQLRLRFAFLFKGVKEGDKAFKGLIDFASKVPFSLEEIQAGAGNLAVVTKNADELNEILKLTGNVAAVTGLDFRTTAEQIQRSFSSGIGSADLFRERGVRALLGFKAGVEVTTEETKKRFRELFGEGGEFEKATEVLSTSFTGTLSMLSDKLFKFRLDTAQAGFFDFIKQGLVEVNKLLETNEKVLADFGAKLSAGLIDATKGIIIGSATIIQALKPIFSFVGNAVINLFDVFKSLPSGVQTFGLVGFLMLGTLGKGVLLLIGGVFDSLRGFLGDLSNSYAFFLEKLVDALDFFKIFPDRVENGRKVIEDFRKAGEKLKTPMQQLKEETEGVNDELDTSIGKLKQFLNSLEDKAIISARQVEEILNKLKGATEESKKFGLELGKVKDNILTGFKKDFESINETLGKMAESGIKAFSRGLAESLILGKELNMTMREIAQKLLVDIVSFTIQIVIQETIRNALKKDQVDSEAKITNELRSQTSEMKKQAFLSLFTGGSGGGIPFMASGGAVSKGQPYMVGEQGAELFVPNQSGQIQQSARGGSGGGATTVNFNINTVDASGFEELLVRSRGTITQLINSAVNERGSKNLI
jgi:hypothetical protein